MRKIITIVTTAAIALALGGCSSASDAADTNVLTQQQSEILTIGNTTATDYVQFTLNQVEFADSVGISKSDWLEPVTSGGKLSAGDGSVFVWFSFTAKNTTKSDLSGYDVCSVSVDFDDGFIYDDATYSSGAKWSTDPMLSNDVGLAVMAPLQEETYYGFIRCSDAVREDRDKSLLVKFELPSSEGAVEFVYSFAAPSNAKTDRQAKEISDELNNALTELTFVQNNAGGVGSNGSRKFADEAIDSLLESTIDVDLEYASANLPLTAEAIPSINESITIVADLLVDMGRTNSDANVERIKSLTSKTIDVIESLLESELKAFN